MPGSATFLAYNGSDPETDRIEEEMLSLYAHISAATYRFLMLLNAYDERNGWHGVGVKSFAHWLNWRCGIGLTAAREKLRVAKALPRLPAIARAFQAGKLSYSKVRALTRVATAENETSLLDLARSATAAQTERICSGYRRVQSLEEASGVEQSRSLSYHFVEDGSIVVRARLPAEVGEILLAALEAAAESIVAERRNAETHDDETDTAECPCRATRADALARIAETYLAAGDTALAGGERQAVIIHVNPDALRDGDEGDSAESSGASAWTARGACLSRETARRLSCDASLVAVYETVAGEPLSVGRRTRSIPTAIRRALSLRDKGCRFPGCTTRRYVDAHHVHHWADGGETALQNLVTLCRRHHRLIHEGGFRVVMTDSGPGFFTPGGAPIPESGSDGRFRGNVLALRAANVSTAPHIGPGSLIPRWHGDRLDLPYITSLLMQCRSDGSRPGAQPR